MKKFLQKIVIPSLVLFLVASVAQAVSTFQVNQGGTGVTTITGIPYGTGTSPLSIVNIGTGVSFSGGTLSATGTGGTVTSIGSADSSVTITNPTTTPDLSVAKSPILTTGRTISITGDLAYTSPSFNGSANITAAGTLATVNSNVGTFGSATQSPQLTVNGKGLITAVSNVTITPAASSITGAGDITKTDDTNVTLTLGGTPIGSVLKSTSFTLGWTGTLGVARGGTNIASYAVGDLLYASGSTTLSKLADVATGSVLVSGGVGVAPAWSNAITVTTSVTSASFIGALTGNASTATALQNSRTLWGQSFDGTANVTGSLTSVGNITGGASSMTIQSGTGNSRTLTLATTTSGGTATNALFINATQQVGIGISPTATLQVKVASNRDWVATDDGTRALWQATTNDQGAYVAGGIDASLLSLNLYGGNVLVGTGTDGSTGKLQVSGAINTTTAYNLGGTSINTAGTLSNVAYLNAANVFTNTSTPNQFNGPLKVNNSGVLTSGGFTPIINAGTWDTLAYTSSTVVIGGYTSSQWNSVGVYASGVAVATFTSTGLGIGNTPSHPLDVIGSSGDVVEISSELTTSGAADTGPVILFVGHNGSAVANLGRLTVAKENATGGNNASYMSFKTRASGGSVTEYMRITSAGLVGIGTTNPGYKLDVTGTAGFNGLSASGVGDTYICLSTAKELRTGATCAASTKKIKTNILSLNDSALNQVMALNPVSFTYKPRYYGGKQDIGFIVEDINKVDTRLSIKAEADQTLADGQKIKKGDPMALNINAIVSLVTKGVQQIEGQVIGLLTRVFNVETRVSALEKENQELKSQLDALEKIVNKK